MRPLSIRAGLTLWFAGLALLLVAAFSVALYASNGRALRGGLDGRLAATAAGLARLCDWDEEAGAAEFELVDELARRFAAAGIPGGQSVHTWPDLRPLYAAGSLPEPTSAELAWLRALDPSASPQAHHETVAAGDGSLRVCAVFDFVEAPMPELGELPKESFHVVVRVAEDAAPMAAGLARLGWLVALTGAAAAAAALLLGAWLARRLLRPLDRLGAAAASVRAGCPAEMPHRGAGDEVDALADHLDHAFERLAAALERQERFTADAAHELRNPVSVIQNAAEVALRRDRTPDEYRAFLGDVLVTSNRMGGAIEALLLLARLDAEGAQRAFRAVDLTEVARDSAAGFARVTDRIRLQVLSSPSPVRGDAGLLRVLLDNLLANAARHSPADRPIEILVEGGARPRLTVRDRGPGIAAEHVGRVFDRFYRAETSAALGSGAGLGLAIVAEVARLHGATPRIETSSEGTAVSVEFPLAAAA